MPKAVLAPLSAEPSPDTWLTAAQIVQWRPALTERTLKTWTDDGLIPTGKRSPGITAQKLYRLADVDALLNAMVSPATKGPLATVRPARNGPLAGAS